MFDPSTGKSAETIGPLPYADISDPQTLNKYAYVRNNPLRYTDPNGHCIEDLCIGELALVGAGVSGLWRLASDYFGGHETTRSEFLGAITSGAIIGGTGGAAAELAIPLQLAAGGSAGVVGGVLNRGISTGSMEEATRNPSEMASDFVKGAAGQMAGSAADAAGTTAQRGAVNSLENQLPRATTINRVTKTLDRIDDATARLQAQQLKVAAAAGAALEGVQRAAEKRKEQKCSTSIQACN